MDPRRLGRSGLEVSPIALGTMMFGAWGNTDAVSYTHLTLPTTERV